MRDRKIIQPRVDMRGFELTITLLRCEIEYDVDFETWKVGDVSGLPGKEKSWAGDLRGNGGLDVSSSE